MDQELDFWHSFIFPLFVHLTRSFYTHWLCRNHWHDLWTICRRRKGLLQPAARVLIKYCASGPISTAEEIAVGIKVPMNLCSLGLIRCWTFLVVKKKQTELQATPNHMIIIFNLRGLSEATVPICGAQLSITLKGTCRLRNYFVY